MKEISVDQVREEAKRLQQEGAGWHFHVLYPGCIFNTQTQIYAFVLEDRTSDTTYVTYSKNGFVELSRELLKLHYGDNILERQVSKDNRTTQSSVLLDTCEIFKKNHTPWHHHMLFPDCVFNRYQGKWSIVLENDEEHSVLQEQYEEEPLDILQKLEISYFEKGSKKA